MKALSASMLPTVGNRNRELFIELEEHTMTSMIPLIRPFGMYAIFDEERGCLLGNKTDHWMIISPEQLRDVRLFDSAREARGAIAGRPGLVVRELVFRIETNHPSAIAPAAPTAPEGLGRLALQVVPV